MVVAACAFGVGPPIYASRAAEDVRVCVLRGKCVESEHRDAAARVAFSRYRRESSGVMRLGRRARAGSEREARKFYVCK